MALLSPCSHSRGGRLLLNHARIRQGINSCPLGLQISQEQLQQPRSIRSLVTGLKYNMKILLLAVLATLSCANPIYERYLSRENPGYNPEVSHARIKIISNFVLCCLLQVKNYFEEYMRDQPDRTSIAYQDSTDDFCCCQLPMPGTCCCAPDRTSIAYQDSTDDFCCCQLPMPSTCCCTPQRN